MSTQLWNLITDSTVRLSMKWKEPYVTEGINKKLAVVTPNGIYRGWRLSSSGTAGCISIDCDDVNADHVAVVRDNSGNALTVWKAGGSFTLSLSAFLNEIVVIAVKVVYVTTGADTTAEILGYTAAAWDALPAATQREMVALGTVTVPAALIAIPSSDITHTRRNEAWESVAPGAVAWASLLQNGGFEGSLATDLTANRNYAAPWTNTTVTNGKWTISSTDSASGGQNLALVRTSDGEVNGSVTQALHVPFNTATHYRLRFKIRALQAATGTLEVRVGFYDSGGPSGTVAYTVPMTSIDSDYRTIDQVLPVPVAATSVGTVEIRATSLVFPVYAGDVVAFRIDDVELFLETGSVFSAHPEHGHKGPLVASALDVINPAYGLGASATHVWFNPSAGAAGQLTVQRLDADARAAGQPSLKVTGAIEGQQGLTGTGLAPNGAGVSGQGTGTGSGLYGQGAGSVLTATPNHQGVIGVGGTGAGAHGVQGLGGSDSATAYGVHGTTDFANGIGIQGDSKGTGTGIGVCGAASGTTGIGVKGLGKQYGVQGFGATANGIGVRGDGGSGARGVDGLGGDLSAGSGVAGTGVYGQGGTGIGGATAGPGVSGKGGVGSPSTVATYANGVGVLGDGGVSGANGVVGRGGDFATLATPTQIVSNTGAIGLGAGSGAGVLGWGGASGGTGVDGRGATSSGVGAYGVNAGVAGSSSNGHGVVGLATGANAGVAGISTGSYPAVWGYGGTGTPVSFATRLDGAGIFGQAQVIGANGVVGQGGQLEDYPGEVTTLLANNGVVGIGWEAGSGVVGISGTDSGGSFPVGVYGEGSDGLGGNTSGVKGVGKGTGVGVYGRASDGAALTLAGQGLLGAGSVALGAAGVQGTGGGVGPGVYGKPGSDPNSPGGKFEPGANGAAISAVGGRIIAVASPLYDSDAANKAYVDQRTYLGNLIINGGFDFWQRGLSGSVTHVSAAGTYDRGMIADRWYGEISNLDDAASGDSLTMARVAADILLPNASYGARLTHASASGTRGHFTFVQEIDRDMVRHLRGKKVSLQVRLRKETGKWTTPRALTISFISSGSAGTTRYRSYAGPSTDATVTTNTAAIAAGATTTAFSLTSASIVPAASISAALVIECDGDTSVGSYLDVFEVLVAASDQVPASFSRPGGSDVAELALCRKYFEKSYEVDTSPGSVTANGVSSTICGPALNWVPNIRFNVPKASTPAVNIYQSLTPGTRGNWLLNVTARAGHAVNVSRVGFDVVNDAGTPVAGDMYAGHWVADAEI